MYAIETSDVRFNYGKQRTISDLELKVEEGDIYGFLGPNGAGKTTTIRLLLGLVRAQQGTIRILGEDLYRRRLEVLAQVGTHVEGHAFYPYLSGRDNLKLFSRYHGRPDAARIDALLETVGLAGAARARVRTYSLGMKQRLGIAQALVSRPRLLILDEPLNGLDPPGVIEVRELLERLNRDDGITIFFSSHRLDEAERICNRIGLIRMGTLVRQGPLEDLLMAGERRLYKVKTSDPEAARRRLNDAAFIQGVKVVDSTLEIEVARDSVHKVARWLIDADIDVEELVPWRASLEDLFRRSMADHSVGSSDRGETR